MQAVDKFMMLNMTVDDMPKAKDFYADKLGLKVAKDYRQDDDHWWVSLALPEGGVTITLTTYHVDSTPSKVALYLGTSDVVASHKQLAGKGVEVSEVQDDLRGPGSGVKFFNFTDPDGNLVHVEQT